MIRQDVALGLGGGYALTKFTLTYQDLTAAAGTQTITLQQNPIPGGPVTVTPAVNFGIPQGGLLMAVKIHHTVAFAGTSWSAATVSVGSTLSGAAFYASAFNVFQAIGDTVLQETSVMKTGQMSSATVTATFTITGGNANVGTAGSVDIYLYYVDVSTSNIGTSSGVTSTALLPGASGAGVGV